MLLYFIDCDVDIFIFKKFTVAYCISNYIIFNKLQINPSYTHCIAASRFVDCENREEHQEKLVGGAADFGADDLGI